MSCGHLHRTGVAESYGNCSFSFLRSLYTGGRYHKQWALPQGLNKVSLLISDSIHCHSSDLLVVVLTQTHRRWNCKVGLICIFFDG